MCQKHQNWIINKSEPQKKSLSRSTNKINQKRQKMGFTMFVFTVV